VSRRGKPTANVTAPRQWFRPPPCLGCGQRSARYNLMGQAVRHPRDPGQEAHARDGRTQARFCTLRCALEYALLHAGARRYCYDCREWVHASAECGHRVPSFVPAARAS